MSLGRRAVSFLAYQAAWFACVQWAGQGLLSWGLLAVAALMALNLALAADRRSVIALALIAGIIGLVVDSGLGLLGVFSFSIAPAWIVALWMAFGSILPAFLSWLAGRYVWAAVLGAVAAPVSYYGGARLGAVELPNPLFSLIAIAVAWAAIMPLLLRLTERLSRARANTV
jgi:hypothetical protein